MKRDSHNDVIKFIRYILLTIAAVSCIYGTVNGEAEAVLRKAVAVCMECCGIG